MIVCCGCLDLRSLLFLFLCEWCERRVYVEVLCWGSSRNEDGSDSLREGRRKVFCEQRRLRCLPSGLHLISFLLNFCGNLKASTAPMIGGD